MYKSFPAHQALSQLRFDNKTNAVTLHFSLADSLSLEFQHLHKLFEMATDSLERIGRSGFDLGDRQAAAYALQEIARFIILKNDEGITRDVPPNQQPEE